MCCGSGQPIVCVGMNKHATVYTFVLPPLYYCLFWACPRHFWGDEGMPSFVHLCVHTLNRAVGKKCGHLKVVFPSVTGTSLGTSGATQNTERMSRYIVPRF